MLLNPRVHDQCIYPKPLYKTFTPLKIYTQEMEVYAMKLQPISSSDERRLRRCRFHFPEGCLVEVRTDEQGLEDVYFSGTVVPPPSSIQASSRKKSRKILYVEFHDLVTEMNQSEKLIEAIDVSFVRPTPPELQEEDESARPFQPNDVVDAFYNDGWWMGVVSRVLEGERVEVTFQNPPDVQCFRVSEIRVHWNWVNGIWVKKQSVAFRESMFGVGNAVEISLEEIFNGDVWVPAIVHRCLRNAVLLVEYESELGEEVIVEVDIQNVRPCPLVPVKDEWNFFLFEEVDAYLDHVWISGVIRKELENGRYVVFLKITKQDKEFSRWDLRPHMEWKDGKWLLSSILDDGVLDGELPLKKRRKCPSTVVEEEQGRHDLGSVIDLETSVAAQSSVREKIKTAQAASFLREGNAISYMVRFAGLVDRACSLRLNDPKGIIDEIMVALANMEEYGFEVGAVQDKLSKLVGLKVKLEKMVEEANKLQNHVSLHTLESRRIEEERRELLEKLSRVESAKEKEDSEISLLQAGLEVIEESIKTVGCDFEGIVSSICEN